MPLTDAQKLECYTILDLPTTGNIYGAIMQSRQYLTQVLEGLSEVQLTLVTEVLTKWQGIKFKTGSLSGRFNQTAEEEKQLYRTRLVNLIGFDPDDYVYDRGPRVYRS